MRCDTCKNCELYDYGYSNWTVEGTTVTCKLHLHPDGEFDRWYGVDKRLEFAETCPSYVEGDPDHFSVEDDNGC